MSTFTQFLGGAKPKQVTTYTTGTGTHATTGANAWCYVTLVAGGGGGGAGQRGNPGNPSFAAYHISGGGGRKGGVYQGFVQLSPNVSYAVGAAGPASGAGGSTTLGPLTAVGGNAGKTRGGPGTHVGTIAAPFTGEGGESGLFGSGGNNTGTGYGAGGGGGDSNDGAGGAGSGGLIIIEDFGP